MNRNRKKIIAGVIVIFAALAAGAFFQVKGSSAEKESAAVPEQVTAAGQVEETLVEPEFGEEPIPVAEDPDAGLKTDNGGNYQPDVSTLPPDGDGPPADVSDLLALSSKVTAQKSSTDENITVSFYAQGPGYFTVQAKDTSGEWIVTAQNVFYAGSGGIPSGSLAAAVESLTLRLFRLNEDGEYEAVSAEFTVSRQEVISAGGIKTYSG